MRLESKSHEKLFVLVVRDWCHAAGFRSGNCVVLHTFAKMAPMLPRSHWHTFKVQALNVGRSTLGLNVQSRFNGSRFCCDTGGQRHTLQEQTTFRWIWIPISHAKHCKYRRSRVKLGVINGWKVENGESSRFISNTWFRSFSICSQLCLGYAPYWALNPSENVLRGGLEIFVRSRNKLDPQKSSVEASFCPFSRRFLASSG